MLELRRKARKWIRQLRWRDGFLLLAFPHRLLGKQSYLWLILGSLFLAGRIQPFQEVLHLLLQILLKGEADTAERIMWRGEPVITIIGAVMVLWWLGSLYAASRARFWEEIERRGFRVLFPSGHREDLLEEAAKIFPLGLGPTGKLLPFYVKRKEEDEIRKQLMQGQHVIIAAPPAAGKTRAMLEIAANLDPPFILIWTRDVSQTQAPFPGGILLPAPWALLLVDDLAPRPGEEPWPDPLPSLRYHCPGLWILATVRSDRLPPDLRGARVVNLKEMPLDDLQELVQRVAEAEGRSPSEIQRRYNGHPGSLVAGLEAMRAATKPEPGVCEIGDG